MPWTVDDVDKHHADLTPAQKAVWVKVANKEHTTCVAGGGSEEACAASAIKQANAVVNDMKETTVAEAATLKTQAQGLLRNIDAILTDRGLSGDLRSQITGLRASLKRKWADLKDEDTPKDAPKSDGDKDAPSQEAAIGGDFVLLTEKAVRDDGMITVKVIAPGWGSSGYYPEDVLERDTSVFTNAKMFWDHPTVNDERERPERSLRDLAGKITSAPRYQRDGPAGPGVYAEAQIFEPFRAAIAELAPHIGVSLRGTGKVSEGEVEGRKGKIIKQLSAARSVDFVTSPGAGGQVLQLFEAAGRGAKEPKEGTIVAIAVVDPKAAELQEAKVTELQEANKKLTAENARLQEAVVLRDAKDLVVESLAKMKDLPDLTRARLTEQLSKTPTVKDGVLDKVGFQKEIDEAIKKEIEYLAAVGKSGAIKNMGGSGSASTELTEKALKESFERAYIQSGESPEIAKRLAELSVQSG